MALYLPNDEGVTHLGAIKKNMSDERKTIDELPSYEEV
jgi:hypothetical protein